MNELENILDEIAGRNETLFQIESASANKTASVTWSHDDVTVLVRFGVADGHLYADVSGWRDGDRTTVSVTEAFNTAIVYMGKEE